MDSTAKYTDICKRLHKVPHLLEGHLTDGMPSRTREIDWGPNPDILLGNRNVRHHLVDLPVGFSLAFLQAGFVELRQRCVHRSASMRVGVAEAEPKRSPYQYAKSSYRKWTISESGQYGECS